MPAYRFTIQKNDAQTEDLGFIKLVDDSEAILFAKQMVEDMMYNDPKYCAGCAIGVFEGKRTVGNVLNVGSIEPKK